MGLKKYEQEIAAAVAHPDTEHAVTVLTSLARSLRRHEWPPERRGAAYDLSLYCEATARRMIAAGAQGPLEESAATCQHPAGSIKRPAPSLLWCRRCGALATTAERSSGQPCVDAERCALKNSKTAVKRFKRSRSCCGLEEWTEIGPDGREYLLGFNFGH